MSVHEAAVTDDRVEALRALRDRLAREIDDCESKRDMAALSQRFMDVVEQIASLGVASSTPKKETGLSDFERRLRERESTKASRRTSTGA